MCGARPKSLISFWKLKLPVTKMDKTPSSTLKETPVATCVISATATNLIPAGEVASRPETPERSLVQRAQQGDEEAFGTLFQAPTRSASSPCASS